MSKKGGIILAELAYDLSTHANNDKELVKIAFPKSKNALKYTDIELNMEVHIYDPASRSGK